MFKGGLNLGNAGYDSIQHGSPSYQISNNMKFLIYRTTVLPVVNYVPETRRLPLKEENKQGCLSTGYRGR